MISEDGSIKLDPEDQCNKCLHRRQADRLCPLLEALVNDIVSLKGPILVQNCGFYDPRLRCL